MTKSPSRSYLKSVEAQEAIDGYKRALEEAGRLDMSRTTIRWEFGWVVIRKLWSGPPSRYRLAQLREMTQRIRSQAAMEAASGEAGR